MRNKRFLKRKMTDFQDLKWRTVCFKYGRNCNLKNG